MHQLRGVRLAVAAGLLLAGAWTATPALASTATSTPTGLRISAASPIYYGDYARVNGRLVSGVNGVAIKGQPVAVFGRRIGTPTWSLFATLTTDAEGLVRFVRAIGGNAEFMMRHDATHAYGASASPTATVLVNPTPTTLRISANPAAITLGQATTVGGRLVSSVSGAYQTGQPLTVYGRRLGTTTWAALANLTTSAEGLIQYSRNIGGTAEFMIVFRGTPGRLPSTSPIARVTVTPGAPAGGRTIALFPSSGPSLQSAVDGALPGDVLALHAGTYTGRIRVTRSGTAAAPVRIQPYGDGTVTLNSELPASSCQRHSPDPNRTVHFDGGVDYWTIQNLHIDGGIWISGLNGGEGQKYLGRLFDSGDWQTRRSIPGRGSYDPAAAPNAIAELSRRVGKTIDPADGIRILNSDIAGRGIHTIAARYGAISGNTIHDTVCGIGPGIWINTYSDGWTVSGNYIHDITASPEPIHHYMYEGIRVGSASSYNRIEANRVANIAGDGRAFNTDVDASWNVFTRNTATGVAMGYNDQASGWGNSWTYNVVDNPRVAGFSFRMKDATLAKPSLSTSTYKSVVNCNRVTGGSVALQAGALIATTFTSNYFSWVQLSNNLTSYWTSAGNTWNGSSAVPPEHPAPPVAGAC